MNGHLPPIPPASLKPHRVLAPCSRALFSPSTLPKPGADQQPKVCMWTGMGQLLQAWALGFIGEAPPTTPSLGVQAPGACMTHLVLGAPHWEVLLMQQTICKTEGNSQIEPMHTGTAGPQCDQAGQDQQSQTWKQGVPILCLLTVKH
jgi:hypothetical protein